MASGTANKMKELSIIRYNIFSRLSVLLFLLSTPSGAVEVIFTFLYVEKKKKY